MNFELTPDSAQTIALAVADYYSQDGFTVTAEVPAWPDVPFRTTLLARRGEFSVLIEAQADIDYHETFQILVGWLAGERHYAECYIATYHKTKIGMGLLEKLKKSGVGLLIIDEETNVISVNLSPRNYALMVSPDPTLKYGDCKTEVLEALGKFNSGSRKDGLRDMFELVERETGKVAVMVARKGMFQTLTEADVSHKKFDWASQINALESVNTYKANITPVIDANFKADLQSFRGSRNMLNHPAKGKRAVVRRERQFAERMTQGPRLIAELVAIRRRIK